MLDTVIVSLPKLENMSADVDFFTALQTDLKHVFKNMQAIAVG